MLAQSISVPLSPALDSLWASSPGCVGWLPERQQQWMVVRPGSLLDSVKGNKRKHEEKGRHANTVCHSPSLPPPFLPSFFLASFAFASMSAASDGRSAICTAKHTTVSDVCCIASSVTHKQAICMCDVTKHAIWFLKTPSLSKQIRQTQHTHLTLPFGISVGLG